MPILTPPLPLNTKASETTLKPRMTPLDFEAVDGRRRWSPRSSARSLLLRDHRPHTSAPKSLGQLPGLIALVSLKSSKSLLRASTLAIANGERIKQCFDDRSLVDVGWGCFDAKCSSVVVAKVVQGAPLSFVSVGNVVPTTLAWNVSAQLSSVSRRTGPPIGLLAKQMNRDRLFDVLVQPGSIEERGQQRPQFII